MIKPLISLYHKGALWYSGGNQIGNDPENYRKTFSCHGKRLGTIEWGIG